MIRISVKSEDDGKTEHLYFEASQEGPAEGADRPQLAQAGRDAT